MGSGCGRERRGRKAGVKYQAPPHALPWDCSRLEPVFEARQREGFSALPTDLPSPFLL